MWKRESKGQMLFVLDGPMLESRATLEILPAEEARGENP
jgi:hypothetical protein